MAALKLDDWLHESKPKDMGEPGTWLKPGGTGDKNKIKSLLKYSKPYEFIGFGAMDVTKPY